MRRSIAGNANIARSRWFCALHCAVCGVDTRSNRTERPSEELDPAGTSNSIENHVRPSERIGQFMN